MALGKPLPPIKDSDRIVITEEDIEAILIAWQKYAPIGAKNRHEAKDLEEKQLEEELTKGNNA